MVYIYRDLGGREDRQARKLAHEKAPSVAWWLMEPALNCGSEALESGSTMAR